MQMRCRYCIHVAFAGIHTKTNYLAIRDIFFICRPGSMALMRRMRPPPPPYAAAVEEDLRPQRDQLGRGCYLYFQCPCLLTVWSGPLVSPICKYSGSESRPPSTITSLPDLRSWALGRPRTSSANQHLSLDVGF